MLTLEQSKTLSTLLVDDDSQFRSGIRTFLSYSQIQDRAINIVGEADRPGLALTLKNIAIRP